MDNRETIRNLREEYLDIRVVMRLNDETCGTSYAQYLVDFYEFLLRRGFKRHQLAALGISRKNALREW